MIFFVPTRTLPVAFAYIYIPEYLYVYAYSHTHTPLAASKMTFFTLQGGLSALLATIFLTATASASPLLANVATSTVELPNGCLLEYVDYSLLTNAQKQDYAQIRCSGVGSIFESSQGSHGEYKLHCAQVCSEFNDLDNGQTCRSFTKVVAGASSAIYTCRLYDCTPYDDNALFASNQNVDDRTAWLDASTCYGGDTVQPTLAPAAGPTTVTVTKAPTQPVAATTTPTASFPPFAVYTTSRNCTVQHVDYPSLTTAQRRDHSNIRCENAGALDTSSVISDNSDFKETCAELCLTITNCRSFTKVFLTSSTYQCRFYSCTIADTNFKFARDQSESDRSAWFAQPLCEIERQAQPEKPNILLMIGDDQSPFTEPYVHASHPLHGKTPALKRLVEEGVTFRHAFSSYPVCGPSRASMLSGRDPDATKIYNFDRYLMQVHPDIYTIPKYFKEEQGYYTAGFGKVFHPHRLGDKATVGHLAYEMEGHWSQDLRAYHNDANSECPDNRYYCTFPDRTQLTDHRITEAFLDFLNERALEAETPWLGIIGFRRPHVNIAIPTGMQDDIVGDLPVDLDETEPTEYFHSLAYHQCDKMASTQVPIATSGNWQDILSHGRNSIRALASRDNAFTLRQLRRFYYASIKWVDENVGRILERLDALDMTNNTIIVYTGDHGWMQGEKKSFCKNSLYDIGARVPLYVRPPERLQTQFQFARNQLRDTPTSLLDIFPTLIELVEPGAHFEDASSIPLHGVSFHSSLIANGPRPDHQYAAYSQYARCNELGEVQNHSCTRAQAVHNNGACTDGAHKGRPTLKYMGYSLRTPQYRYVEWHPFEEVRTDCAKLTWDGLDQALLSSEVPRWQIDPDQSTTLWNRSSEPMQVELYDYSAEQHFGDFSEIARLDLAPEAETNETIRELLSRFSALIDNRFNPESPGPMCTGRGFRNTTYLSTGTCQCIQGWYGPDCKLEEPGSGLSETLTLPPMVVAVSAILPVTATASFLTFCLSKGSVTSDLDII